MEPVHQIYVIFAGDAVYVGRSKTVIRRMRSHGMLHSQWAILENTDQANCRRREAFWIGFFVESGCAVLNIAKDTSSGIVGHSEGTRHRLREAKLGRPLRAETRLKMSISHATPTREVYAKISRSLKHHVRSVEHCRSLSISHQGLPSGFRGRKHSDSSKEKNRLSHIGRIPWNKGLRSEASSD